MQMDFWDKSFKDYLWSGLRRLIEIIEGRFEVKFDTSCDCVQYITDKKSFLNRKIDRLQKSFCFILKITHWWKNINAITVKKIHAASAWSP